MLNHLDLCGLDNDLIKHDTIRDAHFHRTHIHYRQLKPTVTSHLLNLIIKGVWIIARSLGMNYILAYSRVGWYIKIIVCLVTHIPTVLLVLMASHSINYRTVRTHQRDENTIWSCFRLSINDISIKVNFLSFLFLCILSIRG